MSLIRPSIPFQAGGEKKKVSNFDSMNRYALIVRGFHLRSLWPLEVSSVDAFVVRCYTHAYFTFSQFCKTEQQYSAW